jgi:membrane-bound serine protease (ClpP class)
VSIDPNTAYVLTAVGIAGIYVEFLRPGWVLPGAIGGLVAAVALYHLLQHPVRPTGVAWVATAIVLLACEASFWPSSKGLVGVAGAVALTWGAHRLLAGPVGIHLTTAAAVSLPFAGVTVFLLSAALRARMNKL